MPYTRKPRRRFRRRNVAGLATRPRMMPRSLAIKRKYGVDTKVFWFKENGRINTVSTSYQYNHWRTTDIAVQGAPASFFALCKLFDQYKLLGMKVRVYPVNPQIDVNPSGGAPQQPLKRGNVAIWQDQRFDPGVVYPVEISEIIGNNNTKIVNPRRQFSASLWRPKGKSIWGSTKNLAQPPTGSGDPWVAEINMLINDCTIMPAQYALQMYFYTVQYKVIFRGRVDD